MSILLLSIDTMCRTDYRPPQARRTLYIARGMKARRAETAYGFGSRQPGPEGAPVRAARPSVSPWCVSFARERVGHRVIGNGRSYQIHLVGVRPRIIHKDANDIALLGVLRRAPIKQWLPALVGKGTELLDGGHEAPALAGINVRRQKNGVALDMSVTLEDFTGAEHFTRRLGARRRARDAEEKQYRKEGSHSLSSGC
jgi:hypothetical protein